MSARATAILLAAYEAQGLDLDRLCAGLPLPRPDGSIPDGGRVAWADVAALVDRAMQAAGGPAEFEEFMAEVVDASQPLLASSRFFLHPLQFTRFSYEFSKHTIFFGVFDSRFRRVGERQAQFNYRLRDGVTPCLALAHATVGAMRAHASMLGLPRYRVEADLRPHSADVYLTSDPGPARPARTHRRFVKRDVLESLRPVLRDELALIEPTLANFEVLEATGPDAGTAAAMSSFGRSLLDTDNVPELGTRAVRFLVGDAGCLGASVWTVDERGKGRRLATEGTFLGFVQRRELAHGERSLGWLLVSQVDGDARAAAIAEALVPRLSTRLDECLPSEPYPAPDTPDDTRAEDPLVRGLMEALPGAAVVVDASGHVLLQNAAARRLGWSALDPEWRGAPLGDGRSLHVRHDTVAEQVLRLERAQKAWSITPREREVLGGVSLGLSNKDLAACLGCSDATIEVHVTRLLRKSQSESRTALAVSFWTKL